MEMIKWCMKLKNGIELVCNGVIANKLISFCIRHFDDYGPKLS